MSIDATITNVSQHNCPPILGYRINVRRPDGSIEFVGFAQGEPVPGSLFMAGSSTTDSETWKVISSGPGLYTLIYTWTEGNPMVTAQQTFSVTS